MPPRAEAASPAYDVDRATIALNEVGQAIVDDPAYRKAPWEGVSLVAELDGGKSIFGYVYRPGGDWEAEIPDSFDVLRKMVELREAMREPGKAPWKAALFQLRRAPEIQFNVTFEYDDAKRWHVDPSSLKQRVEDLRPR